MGLMPRIIQPSLLHAFAVATRECGWAAGGSCGDGGDKQFGVWHVQIFAYINPDPSNRNISNRISFCLINFGGGGWAPGVDPMGFAVPALVWVCVYVCMFVWPNCIQCSDRNYFRFAFIFHRRASTFRVSRTRARVRRCESHCACREVRAGACTLFCTLCAGRRGERRLEVGELGTLIGPSLMCHHWLKKSIWFWLWVERKR